MIHPLAQGLLGLVLRLAPAHARESMLGDLIEEHDAMGGSGNRFAALWLAIECARSVLPLVLWRLRHAGPTRVALACVAGLATAAAVHAAGGAAWHAVLEQVPLRAWHDPPPSWRIIAGCIEGVAALVGAGLMVATGIAREGGRT